MSTSKVPKIGRLVDHLKNEGVKKMATSKKKNVKVSDMKPSKDAKGGAARRRYLDGRTTAGGTTAGRTKNLN